MQYQPVGFVHGIVGSVSKKQTGRIHLSGHAQDQRFECYGQLSPLEFCTVYHLTGLHFSVARALSARFIVTSQMHIKFCRKCFVLSFVTLIALACAYGIYRAYTKPGSAISAWQTSLNQTTALARHIDDKYIRSAYRARQTLQEEK